MTNAHDIEMMQLAIEAGERVRCNTSPNPWVGCIIEASSGEVFSGSTYEITHDHAEVHAIRKAQGFAKSATAYVTLEPCSHHGQTPPCTQALIDAGISRVVIGISDPDEKVSGKGIAQLIQAGIEVEVGILEKEISEQLAPYITQRKTRRPYVVLKLAMTLDGYIADRKNKSQWITGVNARHDAHRLRAESDAILVGARTVREDDPSLRVRDYDPPVVSNNRDINPMRIVLGSVLGDAKVQPCIIMSGDLGDILDELGKQGILQLLIEGGASVAHDFHEAGLVDRYVLYVAPAIFGGSDALNAFGNAPSPLFDDMWRGKFVGVQKLGSDLRIDCVRDEI